MGGGQETKIYKGVGYRGLRSTPPDLFRPSNLFHAGVALVLEALREAPHLETLDLGANRLSGIGFEGLLPGLVRCPSLRTVEVTM